MLRLQCLVCKHPLFKHSIHLPPMRDPWSNVARGLYGCNVLDCTCTEYESVKEEAMFAFGFELEQLLLDIQPEHSSSTD